MTRLASLVHAASLAALALLISCADGNSGIPQCEDGIDNDRDGLIDQADPACAAGQPNENQDPPAACSDGIDNDGDGLIDFPDDGGCTSATDDDEYGSAAPDCDNGIDDDGDGKIDYPNDPGCRAPNQMDEGDDCPDGPLCPQCGNGRDDDFDGATDFPADPGCTSASTAFEYNLDPMACGAGGTVTELPASGMATGTIGTGPSRVQPTRCTGTVGTGAEVAFAFLVEEPTVLAANTNSTATTVDTVLYVRRACLTPSTELVCNDDIGPSINRSAISVALEPGAYFLIVDAKNAGNAGNFVLNTTFYRGEGQSCTGPSQCAPGYDCRTPAGGSAMSCERPVCSDGRDDDNDGRTDFPDDPGCTSAEDGTEEDTCPAGPGCPMCADGLDNDNDGHIDYPADTACASASGNNEFACTSVDPIRVFTGNLTAQPISTLTNDIDLSCGTDGRDDVFSLRIPVELAELRIDTNGSTADTAIALKQSSCSSFDLQCNDDTTGGRSQIFLLGVQPGEYYLVIDNENSSGTYNLTVRGLIANGARCEPGSTIYTCASGYACSGTAGMETCAPTACNDNVDADGDGFVGYPTDPGCSSPDDTTEEDDCPSGPGCPACSNLLDDDSDTFIDYGSDPGCVAAGSDSELAPCASGDPVLALTTPVITGATTAGRANDIDLSCGTDGRDEVYRLMIPRPLATLTVDTVGSALDTVLGIRAGTCNGTTDLACDDDSALNGDSRITLNNVSVGEYFVIVDDRNVSNPGTYNLRVSGTIVFGGACDPASTMFTCTVGNACQGPAGQETCQLAACNDLVDQDGDGFLGYPTDPGCANASDNDETDDCPDGPMCPACSNGLDDDNDGFIDYPADPACAAAGVNSELAPCFSSDPVLVFTGNVVGATTMGRTNDVDLSCGADGRDQIYRYYVTQPLVSLTVDTFGSDTNTAVAIRVGTCNGTTDLACGVNNFGNADARATVQNVAVGEYFVIVDDLNTTPTTFNLNVSGVIPGGGRCDTANTAFVCASGYACTGAPGSQTCTPGPCNDNIDDDGDGHNGYPDDPGCSSPADLDETDTCPSGPGCPRCADGLDNDGDMLIDYPNDPGCTAASSNLEVTCAGEMDPVSLVSTATHTGTTAGASNDHLPSCRAAFSSAPDLVYYLELPVPVASLRVDTDGSDFDTTLIMKPAACGTTELACDDDSGDGLDSMFTVNNLAAGIYAIIVDGASVGSAGSYVLTVRGTVANGTACTSELFTSGVLTCTAPATCTAGVCQ